MKSLEGKRQESIKQFSEKFKGCDRLQEFEEASREFETLVEKGLIKKRGNNLLSISDKHLYIQKAFNSE